MKRNLVLKVMLLVLTVVMVLGSAGAVFATVSGGIATPGDAGYIKPEIYGTASDTIYINPNTKQVVINATTTEKLADNIKHLPAGDFTVYLSAQENVKLSQETLKALEGHEVSLDYHKGGSIAAIWDFEKLDLTNFTGDFVPAVILDASIDAVAKKLPAGQKYGAVSFEYDGVLPGKAEVCFSLDDFSNLNDVQVGDSLYYYYYNESTGKFELIDKATVLSSNIFYVHMTHCSDYILTKTELDSSLTSAPTATATPTNTTTSTASNATTSATKTGDDSNVALYITMLIMTLGAGTIVLKK